MSYSSQKATFIGLMSLPVELHLLILSDIKPIDQWCLRITNHYFHGLIEPPSREDLRDVAESLNRGRRRHKQFFICGRCNLLRPAKAAQSYDERMRGVYRGKDTWRDAVCEDSYCRERAYYEFKLSVVEPARYVSTMTIQTAMTVAQASSSSPPYEKKEKKGMKKRAGTWWTGVKAKTSRMKNKTCLLKGRAGNVQSRSRHSQSQYWRICDPLHCIGSIT